MNLLFLYYNEIKKKSLLVNGLPEKLNLLYAEEFNTSDIYKVKEAMNTHLYNNPELRVGEFMEINWINPRLKLADETVYFNKLFFIEEFSLSNQILFIFTLVGLIIVSLMFHKLTSNFLKLLLLFEVSFISLCYLFSLFSLLTDTSEGLLFTFYILGVVAAETAVGLSIYICFIHRSGTLQK